MLCVGDVILPLAKLADTGHRGRLFGSGGAGHRTLWTDVGRADVGIKFRRNGRRKERRLPNEGNCQKEKARWLPAEWKKGTESKDSITSKFYDEIRSKGTKNN